MNNEIENKMTESDATVDCIENTYAERDNIIRGLLFNRTVNVIAVSGREIVETAREIHGTSRVCTAALGRMLLAVSMMSAQLKSETDSITATIAGGGPAGTVRRAALRAAQLEQGPGAGLPDGGLPCRPDGDGGGPAL